LSSSSIRRLYGHRIGASSAAGYHLLRQPGVVVEIASSPEKVRATHIVSCNCDTPTQRRAGFTREDW